MVWKEGIKKRGQEVKKRGTNDDVSKVDKANKVWKEEIKKREQEVKKKRGTNDVSK
jgi:hypothetical protein